MPAVRTQLVKWGNSKALRIPKSVIEQAHLQEGDQLKIRVAEGCIIIQPLTPKLTLDSLVAGITPENRYQDQNWGRPVGKEVG
jgi:antitoxin MazE